MTPPPGWYPDPSVPSTERWWDGSAWTEHRRAPRPPEPSTVPMGFGPPTPMQSQGGMQPQGWMQPQGGMQPQGSGRRKVIVLAATALIVVVAAIGTGIAVLGGGDDSTADGSPSPSVTQAPESPSDSPSPAPSPTASDDPTVVTDDLDGITLPVLDGWEKAEYVVDDTILLTTPGTYKCPDGGTCRHGTVASGTVTGNASKDPKTIAREDISKAADHAYDRDELKNRPYGGIVSHQKVKEGSVAVDGRAGYMVRWRVKTRSGPGGYVESLVFPSTLGTESLVCVRFVSDAGPDGPPLSDIDKITKGIRSADGSGTGGGVGSSVGPSQ